MMKLEVKDMDNKLEIKVVEKNNKIIIPYDEDKSYIGNVLSVFPNYGIVEYLQGDKDLFEVKELK